MIREDKGLIDKICLGLCDGCEGKCQRYPRLSATCEDFIKYKAGYDLAINLTVDKLTVMSEYQIATLIKRHLKNRSDHIGFPLRGVVAKAQLQHTIKKIKEEK